jgi:hypothetical protein
MQDTTSLATAGNPATDGATPPDAATQTTPIPTAEEAIATDNIDAIRALMRASDDVLVQSKRGTEWEPFGEPNNENADAGTPGAEAETTTTEAMPGEGAEATAAAEAAEAEAAAAAAKAGPKKDPNRVRISRFAEPDRLTIAHMAENEGMTFADARAALVAEGKLPKAEQATASTAKTETKSEATDAITTKTAEIADLETKMTEAGAAYDQVALTKLTIEHNRALNALSKLESKAEAERGQAQAQEQTKLQSATAQAETSAIEMFPDSGVKGSPLYEAIEDLIDSAKPAAFDDPDWPLTFAAKAARTIGYKPAAVAAAKSAPSVVPRKPARPVPVSPASGASAGAVVAREPSNEDQMQAAGNDVEKLRGLLRKVGTRTLS